jgi:hypothetical protein
MRWIVLVLYALLLSANWITSASAAQTPPPADAKQAEQASHQIYGYIRTIKDSTLTLETRDKRTIEVDATAAVKGFHTSPLVVGGAVIVQGSYDAKGVLHAKMIQRAKKSPGTWLADR